MSHELSETVQSPVGDWWNVYGRTKRPLPIAFPGLEQPTYPSVGIAGPIAAARSNLFSQMMQSIQAQSPQAQALGLPLPYAGPESTPLNWQHAVKHAGPRLGLRKRLMGKP